MLTAIICYALLAVFFVLEHALRRGAEAQSLDSTAYDRKTTRAVGYAFLSCLLSVLTAPFLSRQGLCKFGTSAVAWAGVVSMILGISLRVWANQTLGASYTRTLRTVPGQAIVSAGPYRVLRHPGYAGVLLMWFGAGVALRNWIALIVMAPLLGWAYLRRMNAEEEMLLRETGEAYRNYTRRTWRIIPFIY